MIVDHVDSLKLSDDEVKRHFNELHSLGYLAQGLRLLYVQTKALEDKVAENLDPAKKYFLFGNASELKTVPMKLVACYFHWYAVSACNYVRMVGWLTNGEDSKKATAYVKHVMPEVKRWRDKVGAHFAKASPTKGDTPASLAASIMFPISFDDDAFYANSLALTMTHGGKASTSGAGMRWSLTHAHRAISTRYPELIVRS